MSETIVDEDALLRIPDTVLFRELDGETVILDLDRGVYFGLDAVGTRAWRLIEEHGRLAVVEQAMLAEYEVARRRLRADLRALVGEMIEKGLLEVVLG